MSHGLTPRRLRIGADYSGGWILATSGCPGVGSAADALRDVAARKAAVAGAC